MRRTTTTISAAFVALTFGLGACSSDSDSSSDSVGSESSNSDVASDDTEAATHVETAAPDQTSGGDAPDAGDCSTVPAEAQVESVVGVALLPVEFQASTGCVYFGDGNNAGVYFELLSSPEDLAQFAVPDPRFAEALTDPELPGAFMEAGTVYLPQDGVVYSVYAAVTGSFADDQFSIDLLKIWLQKV